MNVLRIAILLLIADLIVSTATMATARTIELSDLDCDRMAVIVPQAPRASWAMYELGAGEFSTMLLDMKVERSFLIRYPLDRIPVGQRITRAEWIVPVSLVAPAGEHRLHVRRLVGEWGTGVSHLYRMQRPKVVPWGAPGAASTKTDRAAQASAIVKIDGPGEQTVNVTEDVELWYTGAAANQGWIITVEDPTSLIRLNSPLWTGQGTYKLRITYEPE